MSVLFVRYFTIRLEFHNCLFYTIFTVFLVFFQIWKETEEGYFMLAGVLCLDIEDVPMGRSYPRIMKCHYAKGSQQWKWKGLVRTGVS